MTAPDWLPEALAEIDRIEKECSEPDWDCYGGDPVSKAACDQARLVLQTIPSIFPEPEVYPETEGNVLIDWGQRHDRVLMLGCGPDSVEVVFSRFTEPGIWLNGEVRQWAPEDEE